VRRDEVEELLRELEALLEPVGELTDQAEALGVELELVERLLELLEDAARLLRLLDEGFDGRLRVLHDAVEVAAARRRAHDRRRVHEADLPEGGDAPDEVRDRLVELLRELERVAVLEERLVPAVLEHADRMAGLVGLVPAD